MNRNFTQANGVQRRAIQATELRAMGDEFALVGYAATFNSLSKNLGGFREQIKRGTFKRSIGQGADVKCLFNHAPDNILGRTKSGTLVLSEDAKGLRFRCQLDRESQYHRDLYASIKRGDITECSFAFTVPAGGQSWADGRDSDTGEAIAIRTLSDVDLVDVSVVTYPAYNETEADARGASARIAAELNKTHGIIEAVAYIRSTVQRLVAAMRGGDSSPVDFASHLVACHENSELACMMAKRCDELMDDDDCADDQVRNYFRQAKAACTIAAERFASARVLHRSAKSLKAARLLGRSR